jgi:hypothetical protein
MNHKFRAIIRGVLVMVFVVLSFNILAQNDKERPLPQFLFPNFAEGTILTKTGQSLSFVLNYNMVDQYMVLQQSNVYRIVTNIDEIDTIFLQSRRFVPLEKVFYEVLVKGRIPFFLQNKSLMTFAGNSVGYGLKSQTVGPTDWKRFETGKEVLTLDLPSNVTISPASVNWVKSNDVMEKFSNARQLIKIFPEYEKDIKEYILKYKPDFKQRDDLIKLGIYCNGLIK